MSWDLSGKTVLITGAARGIGAETARQLRAKGARLSLVGLEPELLEQRAAELGGDTMFLEADVAELEALERAAGETAERLGGIDIVVANAGVAGGGPVQAMDPEAWSRIIEVNLLGVYRTIRAALPYVTDRSGYVLPIASLAAAMHGPMMSAYAASKAGVEALADSLRTEVRPTGTAVGCAYFSFIDTDMVRRGFERASAQRAKERLRGPLKPPPVDVAGAAIVRGIEKRARFVYAPRWVLPALYLRTLLQPLSERGIKDDELLETMRLSAAEPTELTTAQPEKTRT
jgi:NAD(P)-dependent dehydrogenase (short-subunit alcohol dehydrogenase family)